MTISAPRLFAVVQINDSSLVFASDKYTKAQAFIRSLPDPIMDCFALVRYDPNPEYSDVVTNTENERNN